MSEDFPNQPRAPRRQRRWGGLLTMAGLGFAAGALAMGGAAHRGWLQPFGIAPWSVAPWSVASPLPPPAPPVASTAAIARTQGAMEARVAGLEDKLNRLDLEAAAASGNAARAEALLVAFAARRVVERGASLGYLEDQLKTRFGAAQPGAVAAITGFARAPVTLDRLTARLEALGPMLAKSPPTEGGWARVRREFSELFVLHREAAASPDPRLRLDHAKLCLQEGKVADAIADIRLMPGGALASEWIAQAQRYAAAQQALDAIETTALLEPRALRDGAGRELVQPSPLASPTPSVGTPSPTPAPEASGAIALSTD